MRIALLSSAPNVHTPLWLDYLQGRGHEVHLVSLEHGPPLCENQHNLTRHKDIKQWHIFASVPRARRVIGEIDPDIVFGHYLTSNGFLAALVGRRPLAVVAWSPDIPYATDRHLYDRWRVSLILKRADLTLVAGRHLLAHARRLGADPRRVAATYIGVDPEVFHPGDESRREPELILTNREHKNILHVETFIEALPAVAKRFPGLRATIANDGPRRGSLERMAENLGVRERCDFVGRQDLTAIAGNLRRSLLYVSCSEVDGMSSSLLEALACGAYPILSDIPANREIIEAGARVDLFGVGDANALAERLIARLAEPESLDEARRVNYEVFQRVGRLDENLGLVERRLEALVEGENFVGEEWTTGLS